MLSEYEILSCRVASKQEGVSVLAKGREREAGGVVDGVGCCCALDGIALSFCRRPSLF